MRAAAASDFDLFLSVVLILNGPSWVRGLDAGWGQEQELGQQAEYSGITDD